MKKHKLFAFQLKPLSARPNDYNDVIPWNQSVPVGLVYV